ncbi:hypothetical protein AAFF_G00019460 [Aldrovandia affinis]|uniref:Uncharacterized protein n=1 Tax=Aldrovandia affinis TaxID=143900 RepID=A0AAD7S5P1_9TELE|nr:hypothetical protein AAFF_G00019460 [Aldrovandia affinis]
MPRWSSVRAPRGGCEAAAGRSHGSKGVRKHITATQSTGAQEQTGPAPGATRIDEEIRGRYSLKRTKEAVPIALAGRSIER